MEAEERSEASRRELYDKWQDAIRVKPESQRRWDLIKVVLRSLSMLCAIALVMSAIALVKTFGSPLYSIIWMSVMGALVPAGAVLAWALAEFVTICVRARRAGLRLTGIHPGAHVAMDLLTWLITVIWLSIVTASVISNIQSPYGYPARIGDMIPVSLAIIGLEALVTGLHFTLFVRACMETERRNSEKRIRKAIVSLRQRGLNFVGLNLPDNPTGTAGHRGQESHELSPLAPDTLRNDTRRDEPTGRAGEMPASPERAKVVHEADMGVEENMKFIMPASILREMTGQKFTMMGPADGEQKYPGLRRAER